MKFVKNITLSLILIAVFSLAVLSVSAADVNGNSYINEDISGDSYLISSDFGDLTFDDYSTNDNSSQNFNEISSVNNNDNKYAQKSLKSDLEVVQKSNSVNNIKAEDIVNVNDVMHMGNYTVNKVSDNSYTLTFEDNRSLSLGVFEIYDLDSFKTSINYISNKSIDFDAILLDFKDNLNLNIDPWNDTFIKTDYVKTIIIRGNGAIISVSNRGNNNIFANVNTDSTLYMSNITVKHFNTAIYNHGNTQLNNVIFINNYVDGNGGAIRNQGILKCLECSFIDNYVSDKGGAIYNDKGTQSSIIDCYFDNNKGYGKSGKFRTNDNVNIYTCPGATCLIFNHGDEIIFMNIASISDYNTLQSHVESFGYVKFLVLNITCPEIYNAEHTLNLKNVENLYIYGNGAKIQVLNNDRSNEYNFLRIEQGQFCFIDNLQIVGFNTAVINKGSMAIFQSVFRSNKVDYKIKNDYGGAIYNNQGLITISNSIFEDNYAKNGAAIYSHNGILSCSNTIFSSNNAYGDGGAIYNDVGYVICDNCYFISNFAKGSGGSIFNHYGMMSFVNVVFDRSHADSKGGSIYNDFGDILVGNCTFMVSTANKDGNEIFNYGKEAKCTIFGNSSIIENTTSGITVKQLNVVNDAPSEVLRWCLRAGEVVLCITLAVVASFIFTPLTASVVGFIGGALLAGAEELVEGIYLDHNFNIWNCLVMMAIAGAFDGATTGIGSALEKTVFKTGGHVAMKLGAAAAKTLCSVVTAGIDFVGEVITEVIPRIDFTDHIVPTTIIPVKRIIN